jgi:hypothetical protein
MLLHDLDPRWLCLARADFGSGGLIVLMICVAGGIRYETLMSKLAVVSYSHAASAFFDHLKQRLNAEITMRPIMYFE